MFLKDELSSAGLRLAVGVVSVAKVGLESMPGVVGGRVPTEEWSELDDSEGDRSNSAE